MLSMKRKPQDIWICLRKSFTDRGSTTIFTVIIMSSLVLLAVTFVTLTVMKAETGRADALLSISSRSVLSEYCVPLKERYGLMATDTTPVGIERDIRFYMEQNDKELDISELEVSVIGYTLADAENLEREIEEYSVFLLGQELLDKGSEKHVEREKNRVLKNKKIISALPSGGKAGSDISIDAITDIMKNPDEIFDNTKTTVSVNEYLMKVCNHHLCDDGETFFGNEIEYIVSGELDDDKNYSKMKSKIRLLRNAVNLGVIFTTPELLDKVTAAASATGPASGFTTAVLAEAWALAESNNDVKILENGGRIPIFKNKDTWAMDIESVIKNDADGYIDNKCETGLAYDDYLRVFLYFTDKETKLERFADLVQINIQGTSDENFMMKTACTGFNYKAVINGRKYEYDETY